MDVESFPPTHNWPQINFQSGTYVIECLFYSLLSIFKLAIMLRLRVTFKMKGSFRRYEFSMPNKLHMVAIL